MEEVQSDWNCNVSGSSENRKPLPKVFLIFLTSWQFFFNIQNNAVNVLIGCCRKFLFLLSNFLESEKLKDLLNFVPSTYSEVFKVLELDHAAYTVYVLCPSLQF